MLAHAAVRRRRLIQWNAFVRLPSPIRPAPKRGTVWRMSTSDEELETTWPEDPAAPAAGDTDGEDGGDTDGTDTGDTDGTDTGDTDGTDA